MKKLIIAAIMLAFTVNLAAAQPPRYDNKYRATRVNHDEDRNGILKGDLITERTPGIDPALAGLTAIYDANQEKSLFKEEQSSGPIPALDEKSLLQNVYVPNPFSGTISVVSPDNRIITAIEVFDARGELVIAEKGDAGHMAISADRLRSGTYFIRIWIGSDAITKQINKAG